jgi:PKD repeat protein
MITMFSINLTTSFIMKNSIKIYIFLCLGLSFWMEVFGQNIIGYQYAFNNGEGIQFQSVAPTSNLNLNVDIDVSTLTNALNVFHIRFIDDSGKWSVMKSHLFMTHFADIPSTKQIVAYEYAFNNGANLTYVPVSPGTDFNLLTDIDVSSLTNALNVFHIRFKDNTGKWSAMKSHLFMTHFADVPSTKQIVGYEYAFNNGANLTYVPITPGTDFNLLTDIDVSSLTNALNVFHIRFKDNTGKWSVMKSHLFMTHFADVPSTKQIVGYEYAFNNGESLTYVPVTPGTDFNLLTDIDVSSLTNALNIFHIRFKDDTGKWSVMKSHLFMTHFADVPSTKQIVGYEYAFNNGEYLTYVPITPNTNFNLLADIDVSTLTQALNVLHIRFKDNTGKYSVMKSHLFMKPFLGENTPENQIVEYYYWFDNEVNNKTTVGVSPINPLLVTELNMTNMWEGDHELHSQYKDIYGKYSVVTSHTVHKNPFPIAAFTTDETTICVGQNVEFSDNGSIDYDTVLYEFGDDQTSTELNTMHAFNQVGDFDVTLTVTHTASGLQDVMNQTIHVLAYPINTLTVSETTFPVCYGTSVTLTADAIGAAYLWSNGETTRDITVNSPGNYSVEISNVSNTFCSVVSDVIGVTYLPQINNSIAIQDYPLLLSAVEPEANYQWIDCTNGNLAIEGATNSTYEPLVNGDYALQVTKYGCTVTSDCITISTVNVADYGIKQIVKLYPNPAQEQVFVNNEIPILLKVYNANGALVLEQAYAIGIQNIDISLLSSGLYLTKITALDGEWENQSAVYRLIKQ